MQTKSVKKVNDKIKLNDETFKQFITTLKEEGFIVFTNFMQNVFLYQHQGQLFNKRASYIEELFSLLNPNASLTYDPEKDRVKISGTPILTYTPVSGLMFKGLDLQGTSFSESYFLNSVMNLEYLNLSRTGLINIHPVYSMKNLKHLDISGTPIRSLLVHNSHIKMDYLNLSSTLLTNYKGKQREVDTVDLSNCYSLDPISIFTVAYPPKTVILNESQIAQYPDFYIKAEKKNIRIILK
ncbi:hypothetical protein PQO01_19845 [Lentisphaera marina]|uniref:hypothetical protein n=1 Tax=Lentisphaera marina TaxID=1111041 RepID=UPI0023659D38|nr:hypothetical protein [Lentisphaera marina]MDD7987211.1 hypothetical protein [Lentisphaera marina]